MPETHDSNRHQAHPAAPLCSAFDPQPRTPQLRLPAGSCDCHAHICGPAEHYPYAEERIYTPPDALAEDYLRMLQIVGVQRAVIVQPSVYADDNRVLLKALAGLTIPCRGVAVIDAALPDRQLENLHRAGVRGVRFNLVDVRDPSGRIDLGAVRGLAERVARLGWHAEFLAHVDDYPDLDRMFADFPVAVVFGHMGYLRSPPAVGNAGFQALLRLLRGGNCWVKLTGPMRISAGDLPYPDVTAIARALVAAAPDRLIWGSDWPHVKISGKMPNDGDLVDLLADWIPDAEIRRRILIDNPVRLYDFPS